MWEGHGILCSPVEQSQGASPPSPHQIAVMIRPTHRKNISFHDSGYVILYLQPRSATYGYPFLRKWLGMRLFWRNSNKRVSEQLMLWPTNAGNTMTFLTITTFNQLQSKPLVCMASPLLPRWAVSQRNSLTFQAIPGSDSGSTSSCLWQWSEGTPQAYLPCVQVWSYFSHPQCINQCSCLSFASLQCIAITFRMSMSVFSVSVIDFNMFFMLSVKPLSLRSIVLLLSSAIFCGKNEILG